MEGQASYTAFAGERQISSGELKTVALAVKRAEEAGRERVLVFDDATGQAIDFNTRGSEADVLRRLEKPETVSAVPRGPGRPRLGVVAREVTLLPRQWDWLNAQPGGASVALRRLVDDVRRGRTLQDKARQSRDAAYYFMSAMAGNLTGFEEASRALFAGEEERFCLLVKDWPKDIRVHTVKLAFPKKEPKV